MKPEYQENARLLQVTDKLYHNVVVLCFYGYNRKEQVVLTRCLKCHGRITCGYLLNNEERPKCIPCNSNYSLKHILIDCADVVDVRQTFYNVNTVFDLFTNVADDTILNFFLKKFIYMQNL